MRYFDSIIKFLQGIADWLWVKAYTFSRITMGYLIGAQAFSPFVSPGDVSAAQRIPPHHLRIDSKDTLSQALDRHFPLRTWRIWGKKGMLVQLQKINPSLNDVNRVYPGMVIDIGEIGKEPPVAAPAQIQAVAAPAPIARPDRYGEFSVQPNFAFAVLDSMDNTSGGQATLLSKLNAGMTFSWRQHWNDYFQTAIILGTSRQSYEYQDDLITLDTASRNLSEFGVRVQGAPLDSTRLVIDSSVRFRQELFIRASGLNALTLDAIRIPEVSAGVQYLMVELWPFSISVNGHATAFLPARSTIYSLETGMGYDFGGELGMAVSRTLRLNGGFYFSSRTQNSSIAEQMEQDLGFTFGLVYRLTGPAQQGKEDTLQ